MKNAYQIRHFEQDFRADELTAGLELALSEPEKPEPLTGSGNTDILLQRCFDSPQDGRMIDCEVILDPVHGELVSSTCSCGTFRSSGYACEHVTAILASRLIEDFGLDAFRGTAIEGELKEKTGVSDPFLPGILRKTDAALLDILNRTAKLPMVSASRAGEAGIYSVSCEIETERDGLKLSLRAGKTRKYVVKKMPALLSAYHDGGVFTLGKETVTLGPDSFEAGSRRLLQFLYNLWRDDANAVHSPVLFSAGYNYDERFMHLSGRDLDAFLECAAGIPLTAEGETVIFTAEQRDLGIRMEKRQYGAVLLAKGLRILCRSEDWLYVKHPGVISRVRLRDDGMLAILLERLIGQEELYIRDSELTQIFGSLLPELEGQTEVVYEGLLPEEYRPELPAVRLYLDLPQPDLIACRPMVRYERLDHEYSLYEDTDAGVRNAAEEGRLQQQIGRYFDAYDEKNRSMCLLCEEDRLYRFLTEDIGELGKLGEVFISDSLQRIRVRPLPAVNVGIRLDVGLLHMSVTSADMDPDELMEILSSYSRKKKYYRLKNGSFVAMDPSREAEWTALSETFGQYGRGDVSDIAVPLYRSLYLDEMLKNREELQVSANRGYRELILNMDAAGEADYAVPESLRELLRPYQTEGFRWLKTLKNCGFGGILADDMGLGKTLQAIAFLLSEKEEGKSGDELRTLVVTPASLVYNWEREIEHFAPQLTCRVISGTAAERKKLITEARAEELAGAGSGRKTKRKAAAESEVPADSGPEVDIWITSYDLLKRDIELYENVRFANQIIDEAQYIKNHGTQASKSVRLVQSGFRLALTGTPIENQLSELWSIFDFLMPGFLFGYQRFRRDYEEAIVNSSDETASASLRALVHPFVLRRLKRDVLLELPEKIEKTVAVRLEGEQRKLYDAYAQRLRMYLAKQTPEEFKQNKLEVLKELLRLRQLCCGPQLFLENYKGENAKLEACMELIHQAIDAGHKLLIFSQFTSVLDMLGEALKKERIPSYRIDGTVSKEERMRLVDAFGTDETPVFCISLRAGGTGLNLTAADIVIHYDPWWNVAAQNQATDRAHRIGQEHTVTVYDLIAEKTIEEQIQKLQQSKSELADEILSGEGISSTFIDREEILKIL